MSPLLRRPRATLQKRRLSPFFTVILRVLPPLLCFFLLSWLSPLPLTFLPSFHSPFPLLPLLPRQNRKRPLRIDGRRRDLASFLFACSRLVCGKAERARRRLSLQNCHEHLEESLPRV
uniref:Putative transmembrane protein n=1 Tax=Toxoplasma gondii TgCATBr9 TaxID=943120 RepID=A0A2T6IRM7_TOXGO|nr:putative transmembrane protein [Toxoplasma gondii TgCATBr9]